MNRVLIAYVSHSGSTQQIARFMGNELSSQGVDVTVRPISDVQDFSPYDSIIAGGLLYRFGWHPEIIRFLQKNQVVLREKKVALFVVGLRVLRTPDCDQAAYPVFIDPAIMKPPAEAHRNNLMDSITTMKVYLQAALPAIEAIQPLSLAFFAGKLDLHTLALPEKLIMVLLMLLIGKRSGDYRNWEAIRAWVKELGWINSKVDHPESLVVEVS